jgi:hypothetical protein
MSRTVRSVDEEVARLAKRAARSSHPSSMMQFIAITAIVVGGLCTTAISWRFSFQLGTTNWDGYIWAIFSVALDDTKWLMLPYAAVAGTTQKSRAAAAILIWLVATMYSFGGNRICRAQSRARGIRTSGAI